MKKKKYFNCEICKKKLLKLNFYADDLLYRHYFCRKCFFKYMFEKLLQKKRK